MRNRKLGILLIIILLLSTLGCDHKYGEEVETSKPEMEETSYKEPVTTAGSITDEPKNEYKPAADRLDKLVLSNAELDKYSYEKNTSPTNYDESFQQKVEFETGETSGNASVDTNASGYSGEGYINISGNSSSDTVNVSISVPAGGLYNLVVCCAFPYGEKSNDIAIDGENVGSIHGLSTDAAFKEYTLENVYIGEGEHIVSTKASWGWWQVDYVVIQAVKQTETVERDKSTASLCDVDATLEAKMLYQFICDIDGQYTLSGQVGDNGTASNEFTSILEITGRTPAVLGLDMMSYSPARAKHGETSVAIKKAIDFSNEKGGIVTFCWHWTIDEKYDKEGAEYWRGFYTEYISSDKFDLTAIMNGEDEEGMESLLTDIDCIAFQLKLLQEKNVPILWRPLHEASGGWFWWGAFGSETYIKLWKLMYDRLVNYHEIHNLIWVWNGQDPDWYPGDEYCDVISTDIYPGTHVYTSQASAYAELVSVTDTYKPIALSENGCLMDPDFELRDGALWTWFCTWGGEFTTENAAISETYTEISMWDKVFNHASVITLDELPDLKHYGE